MKILVTGFDPFGNEQTNPAIEVVKQLPDYIDGAEVVKLEIPTVFNRSAVVLQEAMELHQPDYILCIGQAGGRYALTPERIAINQDDARIPDNEGNQPIDEMIQQDGEAAYFSQHPIKAMVAAIQKEGLPASVSNTAGTFVCNHIMYQAIYLTKTRFPNMKAGFMHVPYLPEQVIHRPETPSMNLEDIVRGTRAAISAMIEFDGQSDVKAIGGEIQ